MDLCLPFKTNGEDQLGRWNNITIWEEGNGWWNRLDAEYSVTDQFIVNAEWNQIGGMKTRPLDS